MKIAVVILNWNGRALLEQFLPSVVAHSVEATIYVADNASIDDSVLFVENQFPTVQLIKMTENLGFAGGYNQALKSVSEDIMILINSDIEVTSNWLPPIIQLFESEPNTAIIQPKIKDYKLKTHFEYAGAAGGFIDKFAFPYCRGRIMDVLEQDTGQFDDTVSIFWASGACFAIRKAVFEKLGGFDEDFFAHQEEIDLCWRAFNEGHAVKYTGQSTVYHVGGATLDSLSYKKTYLNFRNSLYMIIKNAPRQSLFSILFKRLSLDGVAIFHFLVKRKFKFFMAVIMSHVAFYVFFFKMYKKRSLVQKLNYYNRTSIINDFFIRKKRFFNSLA